MFIKILKNINSFFSSMVRKKLSKKYIRGNGIEIGALHSPLWIGHDATVQYIDRFSIEDLRSQYPELKDYHLVNVDIIEDGEVLSSIENSSLDFIIGNHMLEHCKNPIGTIRTHLQKLKSNGILYYAIPDKRFTFDSRRELTDFSHLIKDDQSTILDAHIEHFFEWARLVGNVSAENIEEQVKKLIISGYSIHYHVWDYNTFSYFLEQTVKYLNNSFKVETVQKNLRRKEVIAILVKR